MFRLGIGSSVALSVVLVACSKDPEPSEPVASAAAPAQSGGGATAENVPAAPGNAPPPSCEVISDKVWSSAPGLLTGMTPTRFDDGRVAIGVMLAGRPHVLSFDAEGKGEAVRVPLAGALKDGVEKGGKRTVSRVTPALGSGGAIVAFADYHDEYPERRRVVCGPTDSTDSLLEFDGKPLLLAEASEDDDDETGGSAAEGEKPKVESPAAAAGSAEKPAAKADDSDKAAAGEASGGKKPPALRPRDRRGSRQARLAELVRKRREALARKNQPNDPEPEQEAKPEEPSPQPKPAPAPEPKPEPKKQTGSAGKEPLTELRSCRTFVDAGGQHAWAAGSELLANEQKDGSFDYTMVLFSAREHGRGRVTLVKRKLGSSPDKLFTFDALAAEETAPGQFVLTTRYRGTLFALLLDADKKPLANAAMYTGGYPSMARFGADASALVLTSQRVGGEYGLRLLRIGADGKLPDELEELTVPGGHGSKTDPTFARQGSHRYLGYVAGAHGKGAFQMLPVDPQLAPLAPAFTIAEADEGVVDGRLFALGSGRLLSVYLRTKGGRPELVSKVLACG